MARARLKLTIMDAAALGRKVNERSLRRQAGEGGKHWQGARAACGLGVGVGAPTEGARWQRDSSEPQGQDLVTRSLRLPVPL
jgi:hypothetical protein